MIKNVIQNLKIDKLLLTFIFILLFAGLAIFLSASLGILSNNELKFFTLIKSQLFFTFIIGILALFLGSRINYKYYKKFSLIIFIASFLATFLVFVPGISFFYNGAHRWISIFSFSLQPSEFLKLGSIILISFFCVKYQKHFSNIKIGLIPFLIFVILVSGALLIQPDFGTLLVVLIPSFVIFFVGGAKIRDIFILFSLGIILFFGLIEMRPYMKERILTFQDPERESLGAGYQLKQSLIAVGAGQVSGRGFGQSLQKFNHLPEQISDSIFAVYAEETGFIGSILLFIIFLLIILRGIHIAKYTQDKFGKYLAIGIISIFFFQMILNISSAIGIVPLTGVPLPLISKGGSSLVFLMFEFGILLNISKYKIQT